MKEVAAAVVVLIVVVGLIFALTSILNTGLDWLEDQYKDK